MIINLFYNCKRWYNKR